MPKYTEAFFNITHKPVTIMQIRNEYNLDHTVYERRYKGHIFCPYCKAVPLTVVHTNGLLYYRGHPHGRTQRRMHVHIERNCNQRCRENWRRY